MSLHHRQPRRGASSFSGVRRIWVTLLVVCVAWLVSSPAMAQQTRAKFDDTIHVIQQKPVLQKGRLDLVPRFGVSINDAVRRSFKAGGNANYHFTERLYAGALFEWYNFGRVLGGPTSAFEDARTQTRTAADTAVLNWAGGLELGFVPLVGKFALFNSFILYYDIGFTVGGVWADSASVALTASSGGPGATFSFVNRVFLNKWLAVNLEVRDVMFSAKLKGLSDTVLAHSVTASLGLSFYLPMGFEYSGAAPTSSSAE